MTDQNDSAIRNPQSAIGAGVVREHFRASIAVKQQVLDALAEPAADAAARIAAALGGGHKVLVFGNGGSAADAQHFAGEMVGRFKRPGRRALPMLALTTDSTVLTCVANDFSYEEVFSRQVEAFAQPGDVLIGLSTSGRSPNVLKALEAGRARGASSIVFVGGDGGPAAGLADLALVVPVTDTARVQECHITLIHAICDLVEAAILATDEERQTTDDRRRTTDDGRPVRNQ